MKVRIYYYHTDCGGVVYYANYLKFFEEARTEFFEAKGISVKELIEKGVLFVVARQEIDYKTPAFYGDVLDVVARLVNVGSAKLEFDYDVKNQAGEVICSAKTVMVFVGKDLRPRAIPEDVRKKLI